MKPIVRVSLLAALAAVWVVPGTSYGQHPRQPVVRIDRGGSAPPALPDPTGVYEGNVRFTVNNGPPITQPWRIVLKTRACPDCSPGQYWVTGTSFDGISYPGGSEERGSVDAVIDADGTALDFRLTTINCLFVNGDVVAPPQTALRGGSFGVQSGPALTIRNGEIDGSLSGTDCFGRTIVGSVSLVRTSDNPGSSCGLAPGWYQATIDDSRGRSLQGPVYLSASNCDLATRIADLEVNLELLFATAANGTVRMSGVGDCDTQGSGTVSRQSNGTITGSWTGSVLGGCAVNAGPISANFTLAPI